MEQDKTKQVSGELFPPDELTETNYTTPSGTEPTPDNKDADCNGMQSTFEHLAVIRELCDLAGAYLVLPTEALLVRGETVYNNHVELLRDVLQRADADAATIKAVLEDYARVLVGVYSFVATPAQMIEALRACKPYRAYMIDRYGLYMGLFFNYSRYLTQLGNYQDDVKHKDTTATDETRQKFMRANYSAMDAKALTWLLKIGVMKPADFVGVEPAEVLKFFERLKGWAAFGEYATFIFVAKYALSASTEEMRGVLEPPEKNGSDVSYFEFAINAADETATMADAAAERFAAMFENERREEQEQAARAAKKWTESINKTVTLYDNPNIICSRPVEVAPDGEFLGRLPIQRAIDEFIKRNGDKYGVITNTTINRAIETINFLTNFIKPNTEGRYIYHTTINDFCKYAGYKQPNQEMQKELLGALLVISDLYLVVYKPYKYENFATKGGRNIKRKTGGPTVKRVVSVEFEAQMDENNNRGIIIKIEPEALGKPNFLPKEQYLYLREQAANNTPKERFGKQLMLKFHKSVDDLVSECFGYEERRAEAQYKLSTAITDDDRKAAYENIKKVEKYISGHHSDNKKRIARWFDEYKNKKIIIENYNYDAVRKIYSWKRLKTEVEKMQNKS